MTADLRRLVQAIILANYHGDYARARRLLAMVPDQ